MKQQSVQMANVIYLNDYRPSLLDPPTDGGKARIRRRRRVLSQQEPVDDLVMLHADPDTRPSELA